MGFVSISENMDFTTPMGRVVLSTMGSLAQFYSDNLSTETKKGKRERKAQGLYNGLLPFGATKGEDGVPGRSTRRPIPAWCSRSRSPPAARRIGRSPAP